MNVNLRIAVILVHLASIGLAGERLVPDQYRTIQEAIEASAQSDTVVVGPGTYFENINFRGKAITIRSLDPNNWQTTLVTVIDGQSAASRTPGGTRAGSSCVTFNHGEGRDSILDGLTLTNGSGRAMDYPGDPPESGYGGGGVFCQDSSPTVRRCCIAGNGVHGLVDYGGGIALIGDCAATIQSCVIANNEAQRRGAGVLIACENTEGARSTFAHCTITDNRMVSTPSELDFEFDAGTAIPIITNTIIYGSESQGLLTNNLSRVTYSCLKSVASFTDRTVLPIDPCAFTEVGGNISEPPRFVATNTAWWYAADYHLRPESPCLNTGDPDFVGEGRFDIDGQARMMGRRTDIGADELQPKIMVTRPEAGDVWSTGSARTIRWTSEAFEGSVNILLRTSAEAPWQTIAPAQADTGRLAWTLPTDVISDRCAVAVVPSISDSTVLTTEAEPFTIAPDATGPDVTSNWLSLGGDFARTGLSSSKGPAEGGRQWQYETQGAVVNSITIGFEGRVHVACEDGTLSTLSAEGIPIWVLDVNTPLLSAPTIGPDGSLFVGNQEGRLYAVDPNGAIRWTHGTGTAIYSSPAIGPNGNVYVGSTDGILYALGPDGSELWQFATKGPAGLNPGAIFASPAIGSDGTIYVCGLYDPNLYALDPADGTAKWTCSFQLYRPNATDPNAPLLGGWPFASPVVASDGTIYQTLLYDSHLHAVEPETGVIRWSADLLDTSAIDPNTETFDAYADGWSEPALGPDGTIYVSLDDPYLRAVNPNGTIQWATQLGQMGGFTLTVDRMGTIYAACDDGHVYVVGVDGSLIGSFATEGWAACPVIASDGTLIVVETRDDSRLIMQTGNVVRALSASSLSQVQGQ